MLLVALDSKREGCHAQLACRGKESTRERGTME